MFNYVRLSDGGPRRHDGPRSEIEIIADLADARARHRAARSIGRRWRDTGQIREAIAKIVPGLEQIGRDRPHEAGVSDPRPHAARAAVPHGQRPGAAARPRAAGAGRRRRRAAADDRPQRRAVQHGRLRRLRPVPRPGPPRRDPAASRRHRSGWACEPSSASPSAAKPARCANILVRPFDKIKPGNALMYYPEANVLVPRHIDPASRTPAFKNVLVRVEAMPAKLAAAADENRTEQVGAGPNRRPSGLARNLPRVLNAIPQVA